VCAWFWWGNLRERDHWGDTDVEGRIILEWDACINVDTTEVLKLFMILLVRFIVAVYNYNFILLFVPPVRWVPGLPRG
jgi:hypothetical protein